MENKVEAYAYPEHRTKPYLYPNGRVDVEALQELERRVDAIERGCYCHRGLDPSKVEKNTLAYYEGQIEEISAKWQAAEECAQLWQKHYIQVLRERNEAEDKIKNNYWNKEAAALASTITALRGMIGSRDAIIGQKNREIEELREDLKRASVLLGSDE